MNPARLASFRQRARSVAEALRPATIKIDGQSYAASTGGLACQTDLAAGFLSGSSKAIRHISFRLAGDAFAAAGQALPRAAQTLVCTAPEAFAGEYLVESVFPAGTAAGTILLVCTEPPQ